MASQATDRLAEERPDQRKDERSCQRGDEDDQVAAGSVPWLDERQQAAWRSFQVMQACLNAALANELASESDLSLADYVVLVVLTGSPGGSARLFELALHLGWERSRVSHHIARMAARGLVRKEVCPSDRRGAVVVVTDAGRRAIEAAAPSHVRSVRRLFIDVVADEELDAIAAAARRVVAALGCAESAQERTTTDPQGARQAVAAGRRR